MKGENNPKYSERVEVICDNCGKTFVKIPSVACITNKEGENHNFCCKQCYWDFRKEYYVGDKLYNTGIKMNEDFCNKVREATLKQYAEGVLNRQTKPQIAVNSILEKHNIQYTNEKIFKYYSIDNFLNEYNLAIEVMGDYFHANPIIYKKYEELNNMQKKDIIRDKRKHTYIKKYYDINILYIWEYDLKNNIELCEQLILKYINSNGKLCEYNSYNFQLYENQLKLKDNIINPYFYNNPLTTKFVI